MLSESNNLFFEKGLPKDLDAERSVLGGVLLENNLVYQILDQLKRDDFFLDSHKRIFDKFEILAGRNTSIDLVTLSEELRRTDEFERVGGATYVASLIDGVPRIDTAVPYIKILRRKTLLRRLISTGNQITSLAFAEEDDPEAILEQAEALVFNVTVNTRREREPHPVAEVGGRLLDFYDRKSRDPNALIGLSTGYDDINDRIQGLPEGLTLIVARPSHGKSALALNMSCNIANAGGIAYYGSIESPVDAMVQRILASEARVDSRRMRQGRMDQDEWDRLINTLSRLAGMHFVIDDDPALNPDTLFSRLRQYYLIKGGLDLVVIDHILLMARRMTDGKRFREIRSAISYIGTRLLEMSRELHVPFLVLVQAKRDVDYREGHIPWLSDLAESADLERDAINIIFLQRPEIYGATPENRGKARLFYLKTREDDNINKNHDMVFMGKYTRFEQLARD